MKDLTSARQFEDDRKEQRGNWKEIKVKEAEKVRGADYNDERMSLTGKEEEEEEG